MARGTVAFVLALAGLGSAVMAWKLGFGTAEGAFFGVAGLACSYLSLRLDRGKRSTGRNSR